MRRQRMEKVSIIIPTYNRADKIMTSINSVLKQTYVDFELIIVDDGSSDNTQEIVESIGDERVSYVRLTKNSGASAARNAGVQVAKYDVIAFQDSDDLWREDKLAKQMKYLQEHEEFSMIYCPYELHMEKMVIRMPDTDWNGLEGDLLKWLLVRNSIGTPTMLMRKECFLQVGGFDISFKCLEDWEFALRFAEKYKIGYVNEVLVDAFYSKGGISSGITAHFESRSRLIAKYRKVMVENGTFDPVVQKMFSEAQQYGVLETAKTSLLYYISNGFQ